MHTLLLIPTKKAAATAIRNMLMLRGYEVLSSSDSKSGIETARLCLPDYHPNVPFIINKKELPLLFFILPY